MTSATRHQSYFDASLSALQDTVTQMLSATVESLTKFSPYYGESLRSVLEFLIAASQKTENQETLRNLNVIIMNLLIGVFNKSLTEYEMECCLKFLDSLTDDEVFCEFIIEREDFYSLVVDISEKADYDMREGKIIELHYSIDGKLAQASLKKAISTGAAEP